MIGREPERKQLSDMLKIKKARFLAIYGRRRIGKTYLVNQFFEPKTHFLSVTGLKDGKLKDQLNIFTKAYAKLFYDGASLTPFSSWQSAFEALTKRIHQFKPDKKCVLFLDELPWLASKRGKLLPTLDHFWNTDWSDNPNFILIVCGSAASWMLKKLIRAKGGLHNRLTDTIQLNPFTLEETRHFLKASGFRIQAKTVLDTYMIFGGVPFYLEQLNKSLSLTQNIDALCFKPEALLYEEFQLLFPALFSNPEEYMQIIRCIANHHYGITRDEMLNTLGKNSGGDFNEKLFALEAAGFIRKHIPFGHKKKIYRYRITDEYTLFYLKWIEPFKQKGGIAPYWHLVVNTPAYYAWSGLAFESICYKNLPLIRKALSLDNTVCRISSWNPPRNSRSNAQIDLLIDRDDNTINVCEIKYLNKAYAKNLLNKLNTFEAASKNKQILLTLITAQGLKPNTWSLDLVDHVVDFSKLLS
jgi:uncharacterized protein